MGNTVGSPQNENEFENLAPGEYWIAVKDANDQIETIQIEIVEPAPIQFDTILTNIFCEDSNSGSIEIINVSGGSGAYAYGLNSSEISLAQSENLFENLSPGNYTVHVFDANGCTLFTEITLYEEVDNADFDQDGISDQCDDDIDGDGVLNAQDQCPETPLGSTVDNNGCNKFSLPVNNFTIQAISETCPNSDDGRISVITAINNLLYTGTLTMGGVLIDSQNFTSRVDFTNLEAGTYQLCIGVDEHPTYEKCFSLSISEPETLDVSGKLDSSAKAVTLRMRGASSYTVTHNNTIYQTSESEFTLQLDKDVNVISVTTDKDCQGTYEETFLIEKSIRIYPNPVTNQELHLVFDNSNNEGRIVSLYTLSGSQLLLNHYDGDEREIVLDLPNVPPGTYMLMVIQDGKVSSEKIIIK